MTRPAIATFNTGSSSVKVSLRAVDSDGLGEVLFRGAVNELHTSPSLSIEIGDDNTFDDHSRAAIAERAKDPAQLIATFAKRLESAFSDTQIVGTGHRIVHGGRAHETACLATSEVLSDLNRLGVFAPSHQPHNLAGVEALSTLWPDRPQSLSFDTAFHRTQPAVAQVYALPRKLTEEGLIRYGFHGLSYAHIAHAAPRVFHDRPHRRLIAAHLGSGASLCAMVDGRSMATTMGLTALDGLPMATRCGNLDPGVILHLIQDRDMSAEDVAELLYQQSGLLGVSGLSGDTRVLLASDTAGARDALDLYVYRIVREISAMMGAIGGIDALVLTGGVGENAGEIRRRICRDLSWLGVRLDARANESGVGILSSDASDVSVAVIPANEELIIAEDAFELFRQSGALD